MNADRIDTGFIVGYGGWSSIRFNGAGDKYLDKSSASSISGELLQVNSASISRTLTVPTVNSYYLPQDKENVQSPIRTGFGIYGFSGNISFELSNAALFMFSEDFFRRNAIFHLQFFDGKYTTTIYNCVWSSISISCSPNSLCSVSMSFQSNNGYQDDLMISESDFRSGIDYDSSDFLIPYWQCGMEGIESFNLNFDRSVTPVYLNNSLKVPSYLRAGLVGLTVEMTCLDYVQPGNFDDDIVIRIGASKGVKLRNKVLQSLSYNISTLGEIGTKTYTWNSISQNAENAIYSFV